MNKEKCVTVTEYTIFKHKQQKKLFNVWIEK